MKFHHNIFTILWIFCILAVFLSACGSAVQTPTIIPQSTDTPKPIPTSTEAPSPTPTLPATPTLAPESDLIKGAWFVDYGLGDGVDTLDGTIVLRDIIRPLGANWIAIQVVCNIDIRDFQDSKCNADNSLPDSAIVNVTNTAHSLGLRVALFPFAMGYTDANGVTDNWSAGLNFGRDSTAWDAYFDTYAENLLHYAEIAEQNKVDLVIIGGEQTEAQSQEQQWRKIISQVRAVYHGPITYDAWCQHYKTVNWWDAVDYIGINFYCFPLAKNADPSVDEVKTYYLTYLDMVKAGSEKWNKPIIFTEIGYQSVNGVSKQVPFGYPPVLLDTAEQGTLVQAFFEALKEFGNDDGWLKGMFWYNFSSNPLQGGLGDINFLPHNKPAEAYLRSFYTSQPVTPVPPLRTQLEEDAITESYWIFDGAMKNFARIGPWAGEGKQIIVRDPLGERGDVMSIKDIHDWEGFQFYLSTPINMHDYDFVELYLYAPKYEPNLEIRFDDFDEQFIPRRLYIRSFIDHEPLLDNHWHRIQIPLDLLFPEDREDFHSIVKVISVEHFWPGQIGPITFFMDDMRLIKVK